MAPGALVLLTALSSAADDGAPVPWAAAAQDPSVEAVVAPPLEPPPHPGTDSLNRCSDFRLLIPVVLPFPTWPPVITPTIGLPDEGWVWVDPRSRYRWVSGTVLTSKVTHNDTPANHDSHDFIIDVKLDRGQSDRLTVANGDTDDDGSPDTIELEWETGLDPESDLKGEGRAYFPRWVWPSVGDRIWAEGHWVLDCGHPDDDGLIGPDLYYSEIHPPRAVATMRETAAPVPGSGTTPVPVTQVDLYVHGVGGFATEMLNCGLPIILGDHGATCGQAEPPPASAYKTTPINEKDVEFDVCLPQRPLGAIFSWRVGEGPGNTVPLPAPIVTRVQIGDDPLSSCRGRESFDLDWKMHVRVPLAGTRVPPTARYARQIVAGWIAAPDPVLSHRQVTLTRMDLHNDQDPQPFNDGELSFFWMNVNRAPAAWRRLSDFALGNMNDYDDDGGFGDGYMVFEGLGFDFYLRNSEHFTVHANGFDQDCYDRHNNFGRHKLRLATYVGCFTSIFTEFGNNDPYPPLFRSYNADVLGHEDVQVTSLLPGSQSGQRREYDLEFDIDDVPLVDEDTTDLRVAKSCRPAGEVALVGTPFTCTITVANAGPGLPRALFVEDQTLPETVPVANGPATWGIVGRSDFGPNVCEPTGAAGFRCPIVAIPVGESAAVTVAVTPLAAGRASNEAGANTSSTDLNLEDNTAGASIDVALPVTVDVWPASVGRVAELLRRGLVAVAVLSTPELLAQSLDPPSLCFGDAEAPAERACRVDARRMRWEDVDGDGLTDLLTVFRTSRTGIDRGDTQACLTGRTRTGISVYGCDTLGPN